VKVSDVDYVSGSIIAHVMEKLKSVILRVTCSLLCHVIC